MKIIYQGDHHLFDAQPTKRIDDLKEGQFRKLQQLIDWSNDHGAYLLFGGDLFDKARPSAELINRTGAILRKATLPIFAVLGQHEMPYHSPEQRKSPVYTLNEMGSAFNLIKEKESDYFVISKVAIHAAHWEQEPTPPEDDRFNILLGHISVFKEIPFYWKGEGYTPETLRKKYPGYDLYLCGDIHVPLVDGNVVVSGPMMRRAVTERDYKPRAYLIDTDTMSIEPLYYDISDDPVFDITDDTVPPEQVNMQDLIAVMNENQNLKQGYQASCLELTKNSKRANEIVKEIFNETAGIN